MKFAACVFAASILAGTALAELPEETPNGAASYTPSVAKADADNWRAVDPERLFIFDTTKGRILIEAFPEIAPKHVEQFTAIIRSGLYDGTSFHRVLEGFMAQGGDIWALNGEGSGLPNIEAEFTYRRDPASMPLEFPIGDADDAETGFIKGFPMATLPQWLAIGADSVESWMPHCPGVVSTARLGDDENSANSQFFLMRGYADHLDKNYTAWGRVIAGQEVVMSLKKGPDGADGKVTNPDILKTARVAADLPEGERPAAWVMRTDGPEFSAMTDVSTLPHVCDLPPVPAVVER